MDCRVETPISTAVKGQAGASEDERGFDENPRRIAQPKVEDSKEQGRT
jgi:hypothetical protein